MFNPVFLLAPLGHVPYTIAKIAQNLKIGKKYLIEKVFG